MPPRILWVDDEIDLLRPHLLFLETKGYEVSSVSNGADAVEQVQQHPVDLVLLDEQMPGMGGLETLEEIKRLAPEVPVVMVTKSEEEHLMEEALGGQISDYLTKPVNPSQVLLTCKRLLDRPRLRSEKVSQNYLQAFNRITRRLMEPLSHEEWVELLDGQAVAEWSLPELFSIAHKQGGHTITPQAEEFVRRWVELAWRSIGGIARLPRLRQWSWPSSAPAMRAFYSRASTRATTLPPKPPPVIRAPTMRSVQSCVFCEALL